MILFAVIYRENKFQYHPALILTNLLYKSVSSYSSHEDITNTN